MAVIYIDDQPHEVAPDQNLLRACLGLGFDIPYFCWHPALGSVGACRQCAVKVFKDENDRRGQVVMSCMTPVRDGLRLSIDDPDAKRFRATVIEWLMLNHPHDCPVCDEGGHCHLQDMTVMTGHNYRRHRFAKRTHRNQDLGPFIHHEMNRCIQCYRCVRFYRDYAGGKDLGVFGAHNHLYFGRHESGPLESIFAGNLVEVCPTGVFTDKPARRYYARKWDLTSAPSVCARCGVGCNTLLGARYDHLVRVDNRYHHEINGYFLCDRGRFGHDFVNDEQRIRRPLLRDARNAPLREADVEEATARAISHRVNMIGIGSPRASLEANFALRELVGADRFYLGLSDSEHRMSALALSLLRELPTASLHEIETADAALVLGDDVLNSAPRMALSLRQLACKQPTDESIVACPVPRWNDQAVRELVQHRRGPLFIATPAPTEIDDDAARVFRGEMNDIARLGLAVAEAVDGAESDELTRQIAESLKCARRVVIVSGIGTGSEAVLRAAAAVTHALRRAGREASLCLTAPECNTLGLALIGGKPLSEALRVEVDAAIVLENDLFDHAPYAATLFEKCKCMIAIDHSPSRTLEQADIVFPATTIAESTGTFVNHEGRAQRFFAAMPYRDEARESWRWLDELARAAGRRASLQWPAFDDICSAMAHAIPALAKAVDAAPSASFHAVGGKVPRQPLRFSGRTAITAKLHVSENKPPNDFDSPLAFSMEGDRGRPPAALIARYWAPGWNSAQALNKFQQEIGGPLRGGGAGVRLIEARGAKP